MDFKIDTKSSYTHIIPSGSTLNAILSEAISQKCKELTKSGSLNYIIDLVQCKIADRSSLTGLIQLHEQMYSDGNSFVITGVNENVMEMLKAEEADHLLNIAPTLIEAVDIVSMEILERDLFNEE